MNRSINKNHSVDEDGTSAESPLQISESDELNEESPHQTDDFIPDASQMLATIEEKLEVVFYTGANIIHITTSNHYIDAKKTAQNPSGGLSLGDKTTIFAGQLHIQAHQVQTTFSKSFSSASLLLKEFGLQAHLTGMDGFLYDPQSGDKVADLIVRNGLYTKSWQQRQMEV